MPMSGQDFEGTTLLIMYLYHLLLYRVPKFFLFQAWIEDWEWECIPAQDKVAEMKLLPKYGGMRWYDADPDGTYS